MPKRASTFHVSASIIPFTLHGSKWIMTNINIDGTEEYPHVYVRGIENVKRTCIFAE